MRFENFNTRRITIRKAKKSDIKEYQQQLQTHDMFQMDKISIISDGQYLALESDAGKMIGLIRVTTVKENEKAYIEISVPNEAWRRKYGTEALHQFAKCCKIRKMYKKLILKESNSIAETYKKERPQVFENGYCVDLKEIK